LTTGTAALGQPYGVFNPAEPMSAAEASAVLDRCWQRGITSIDTAVAYGDSEQRIGEWVKNTGQDPTIFSKAPPLSSFSDDEVAQALSGFIDQSLKRLNRTTLDGYLLHRADDWRRVSVRRALQNATDVDTIKAIAISGYDPPNLLELMEIAPVDVIQMPINLFDQIADKSELLAETGRRGTYVMARSVYLQGLLFMDPASVPAYLAAAAPVLKSLRNLAVEAEEDLGTIALHTVLGMEGV